MRAILGFFGGILIFLGASCAVAELLLWTVGGADTLFSLRDLWASLRLPGVWAPAANDGVVAMLWTPVEWVSALPSWFVFLTLGTALMLSGGRARERTFG